MLYQIADLAAVLITTDLMLVLIALGPVDNPLRAWLGLALALFLPGYALVAALFPGPGLGLLKRVTLSIASSLGISALGGLLLNQTGLGLQPATWAVWLGVVTLVAALVALLRRRNLAPVPPTYPFKLALPDAALLGVAVVLIVLAVNIAREPAPFNGLEAYSSLWMVQGKDTGSNSISVGVESGEFDVTGYKLQLLINNQVVKEWPSITLKPGEVWEATVQIPPGNPGRRLDLNLYRLDAPTELYRHTGLTLDGNGG